MGWYLHCLSLLPTFSWLFHYLEIKYLLFILSAEKELEKSLCIVNILIFTAVRARWKLILFLILFGLCFTRCFQLVLNTSHVIKSVWLSFFVDRQTICQDLIYWLAHLSQLSNSNLIIASLQAILSRQRFLIWSSTNYTKIQGLTLDFTLFYFFSYFIFKQKFFRSIYKIKIVTEWKKVTPEY